MPTPGAPAGDLGKQARHGFRVRRYRLLAERLSADRGLGKRVGGAPQAHRQNPDNVGYRSHRQIGVFHGKLLIALAHLAQPGSKVTAIDVSTIRARILMARASAAWSDSCPTSGHGPLGNLDYGSSRANSSALNAAES